MSIHNKSFIIKFYRNKLGLTQEQLAEGICNTITLAKYENGTLNPSDDNFHKIMSKLWEHNDMIIFNVQTDNLYFSVIRDELLLLFESHRYEEAQQKIDKIKSEKMLCGFYKENQQFIERIQYNILIENNMITIEEYIKKLESLLKLTFPEYNADLFISKLIYTETELLILNNIATAYGQLNQCEIANTIFYKVIEQLKCSSEEYKPIYLLYINYANFLGIHENFDKSIEVCKQGIHWLIQNNKANYLYNFYYNIGWNLLEKYKKEPFKKKLKELGKLYIWESYELCMLYPESSKNAESIKDFYNEIG